MKEHLELLGYEVRDRVTGRIGVVTSISFDLYGCVQAIVISKADSKAKDTDPAWYDTKRLVRVSRKAVMPVPSFEVVPGPERKPIPR